MRLFFWIASCVAVTAADTLPHLTGTGIQDTILASDDFWALAILEDESVCGNTCEALKQTFETIVTKSDGLVRFAYTNAREVILGAAGDMVTVSQQFNLTHIPAILLYGAGPKKLERVFRMDPNAVQTLAGNGPKMLYHNLRTFVASAVQTVRPKGIADFLTKSFPLLHRVLLITDKRETTMLYKKLSLDFASRAVFGQAAGDPEIKSAFGVTDIPTLLVGHTGPYAVPDNPLASKAFAWTAYTGEMTYPSLRSFLDGYLEDAPIPRLTSNSAYQQYCGNATGVSVCFIAVLPAVAQASTESNPDDVRKPVDVLRKVANRALTRTDWDALTTRSGALTASRLPLGFMRVDPEKQADFVAAFSAPSPGMFAVNPRKRLFALFRGAFMENGLYDFVTEMMDTGMLGHQPKQELVHLESIREIPKLKDEPRKPAAAKPTNAGERTANAHSADATAATSDNVNKAHVEL